MRQALASDNRPNGWESRYAFLASSNGSCVIEFIEKGTGTVEVLGGRTLQFTDRDEIKKNFLDIPEYYRGLD